ncbi:MAG: alanine--tRNA ligase [Defluviitaleaceae bacterium]|nr:alanine--tRNA ligase [Defluviitaleaceae bacterium]
MKVNEIRELYLSFFEKKQHLRLQSSSLIPYNDNSLLLINSGMAPLKPYFVGLKTPPNNRITTCQKCIRTGDIENVGKTARHGTFFEMLGNFSFNDYFKIEAIEWAFEFCTEILKLPKEKIYVSIYEEDNETYDIWQNHMNIPKNRIVKLGKNDNFWEVGTGPCGPCSEFYFDRGEKYGCGLEICSPGCDCDRFMEFWNLVFTQFNKEDDGSYSKLDRVNIDTGMGLERMAVIMQEVDSIFDIDTISNIIKKISQLSNKKYKKDEEIDISIRKITDHVRSITFMIADGILPSNEGRGYVLRRLLRVAVRHGKKIGMMNFIKEISEVVINDGCYAYPELLEQKEHIFNILNSEEINFYKTLDSGNEILEKIIKEAKLNEINTIDGSDAFKMYDTYGFPIELMEEILLESGLKIDKKEYENQMNLQKQRARNARENTNYLGTENSIYTSIMNIDTKFVGYDKHTVETTVKAIIKDNEFVQEANAGDKVAIIIEETTIYPESGGQKSDVGFIGSDSVSVNISNCKKIYGKIVHLGEVIEGILKTNDKVTTRYEDTIRDEISRNHTATHLLHASLKKVLGNHVNQSGTEKSPQKLRFDFNHIEPVKQEDLEYIEQIVNEKILENLPVNIYYKSIEEAKKDGAMALFGEKYDEIVRVVNIGFEPNINSFSMELCGGTHVKNTGNIGFFKIISESGVAQGIRRIEAITGYNTIDYVKMEENLLEKLFITLKSNKDNVLDKANSLILENKELKKQIEILNSKINSVEKIMEQANVEIISGKNTFICRIDNSNQDVLKSIADKIKDKLKSCIVVLIGANNGTVPIVVTITDDIVKLGFKAGDIVKKLAKFLDGNGGGRPNMATAQGKNIDKIDEALLLLKDLVN